MSSQIVCRAWLIHLHSSNGFLYCLDLTHSDWGSVSESMLENDSTTMNDKGFTQWPGSIEKHRVIRSLFWSHIPSFETSYSWNAKAKTHWEEWCPPIFLWLNPYLYPNRLITHPSPSSLKWFLLIESPSDGFSYSCYSVFFLTDQMGSIRVWSTIKKLPCEEGADLLWR